MKTVFLRINDRTRVVLPWVALLLVLLISLWLYVQYVRIQAFDFDEGIFLMVGLLANADYPAYSVTYVDHPPLALLLFQLGAKLFGTTIAVRYPMMLVSLVGVGSIFWLFRPKKDLFGLIAGTLAALSLSLTPLYLRLSASILVEAPAIAMALLSLLLAQQFYYNKRSFWLVLSGVAFGFSLTLKSFVIFLPVLIGYLILLAVVSREKLIVEVMRQLIVNGGLWGFGVVLPVAVFVFIYDPLAMYQQVIAFRFALREVTLARGITPLDNVVGVMEALIEYSPQFVVAGLGVIVGWRKRRLDIIVWLFWLILAVILLIWHVPSRSRYFILFLPALAALDSLLITWVIMWLIEWDRRRGIWFGRATAVLLIVTLVGWLIVPPVRSVFASPLPDSLGNIFGYVTEELRDAIGYVETNTTVDDCVLTDDQRVAVAAGRLAPPALSVTANARLRTGWLVDGDSIIREVETYACPTVIYKTQRFEKSLPDLQAKLRDKYLLEINYDEHLIIYAGQKNVTRLPEMPFDVKIGDNIELRGVDLMAVPWYPGQTAQLATYWTAFAPPPKAYKIFLRLRNDQDETVANFDHFPFPAPSSKYRLILTTNDLYQIRPNVDNLENIGQDDLAVYPGKGMVPTNGWPAGNTIREVTTMNLPTDLPPGPYHLYIGLYDPDTLIRLPIQGDAGETDEFLLVTVEVIESP